MNGIVNWYVLSNIFGDDFQFTGALIDYIRSEPVGGEVYIEFIVGNKAINPPARWKHWDKVYVKIDFSFVKRFQWRIENKHFIIKTISIQRKQQAFCLEIKDENGNVIEFDFEAARIQNVKPLTYNEEFGRYEAD